MKSSFLCILLEPKLTGVLRSTSTVRVFLDPPDYERPQNVPPGREEPSKEGRGRQKSLFLDYQSFDLVHTLEYDDNFFIPDRKSGFVLTLTSFSVLYIQRWINTFCHVESRLLRRKGISVGRGFVLSVCLQQDKGLSNNMRVQEGTSSLLRFYIRIKRSGLGPSSKTLLT